MPPNPQSHHHALAGKRNHPNLKILTFILKTTIMLLVISSFLLLLSIAALHLLFLHRRRRPAAATPPESPLPSFIHTEEEREREERCAVCLEGYREGDKCTRLPGCCHVYHSLCVDTWLAKVPSCPVCRTRVRFDRTEAGPGFGSLEDGSKVFWSF